MDAAEVKDRLKSVINNLIKDQPEEASKDLHDVLAAKMRDRISPEEAAAVETATVDDDNADDDGAVEIDDDNGEVAGDE